MTEKRFGETERNCYYTSLVFDNQAQEQLGTDKVVDLLNEQQATISALKEENEQLRQMIKENVFGRYVEGSLEDLKFKAIAYDDIIKLKISNKLVEPKLTVVCKRGKKENVQSFCRMFIPHGMYYEIKELEE